MVNDGWPCHVIRLGFSNPDVQASKISREQCDSLPNPEEVEELIIKPSQ